MRYREYALALVLIVSACASQNSALIACRAYDGTLRSLAGYRAAGELSEGQIATVDQWRPILNSACTGSAAASDVLDQIEQGVFELMLIEELVR